MGISVRWVTVAVWVAACEVVAQPGRIYTKPDTQASGGIEGRWAAGELSHAIAVRHRPELVFRGEIDSDGRGFRFEQLPVGKYDLVLVTRDGRLYEGLNLGAAVSGLARGSESNLVKRIAVADAFFNRHRVHRCGLGGERVLVFVERLRDAETLKQSGEELRANVRRLEIIELEQATDDWQIARSRHLYRETEQRQPGAPFFMHAHLPTLGNVRVVDSIKQLGILAPTTQ